LGVIISLRNLDMQLNI